MPKKKSIYFGTMSFQDDNQLKPPPAWSQTTLNKQWKQDVQIKSKNKKREIFAWDNEDVML